MMNTKILHIKVVLFVVLQCVFISAVTGQGVTCEPGEGVFDYKCITSGYASQCSGTSKITTEAECILAATYNSKNSIPYKNWGYMPGGASSSSIYAPGCFYKQFYYYWNTNTKSTAKCGAYSTQCICKTKTCINCPSGKYQDETGSTSMERSRRSIKMHLPH